MRCVLLVLSLCAGTAVFAQSNPAGSYKLELTQPAFTQSAGNPSNLRADLHATNEQLWKSFAISSRREPQRKDKAEIDPGMIIRGPKSSVVVQPPGTPIAQNLYPGLELLPIVKVEE